MELSPERVAARYRKASDPEYDESTARLDVIPWMDGAIRVLLRMKKSGSKFPNEVGWIMLRPEGIWKPSGACSESIQELTDKVFGGNRPEVWQVLQSDLAKTLHRRGWGNKLYLQAFNAVRPAIVTADACRDRGGETSTEAGRVWVSLAKKFPSAGRDPKSLAIAVR